MFVTPFCLSRHRRQRLFLVPEYGMVVRDSENPTREDLAGSRQMTQVSTDVMV